ncbi:HdeD family acid-resistance protein [Streptomyces sp. SID486]|uniref:HdeD family acid-resistance protein n=1 Tax=unclassified Streptomyces TaxID=2593676 RepID=UPI00136C5685|nr:MULTISPECIES: HdeD family acid-resistance protein [unclassified Streptomyces]MYW17219.1 HdeD family acid-resistance protein [Streptomyces sp. SID2955]MYW44266.1 HdeD family acid-resistance protein [Streptomyces sp. SID161]MYX96244.1 HdeD family acid-resistance protein [Streptomyces sp. SID486]
MTDIPSSGPDRDRAYDDRYVHETPPPGGHPAAEPPGGPPVAEPPGGPPAVEPARDRHEPEPPFEGPLHALSRAAWQVVLLTGIGSLVLGILVLVWPGASLLAAGVLFGLYLLYSGIFQLVSAFGTHRRTSLRVLAFISGALSIVLGLFCFRGPMQSILLLALWIGIGWLIRGITQTVAAVHDPHMPARGWQVFLGIVTFVAGIVLIDSPFESVAVLTLVAGIWLVVVGIVEIVTAFRVRGRARHVPQTV